MLDDKTDIIAHFIGIFELNTEAARLKIQYQEVAARIAAETDLGQLLNVTVNMTSNYGLNGFLADLKWPLSFISVPVSNFSILVPSAVGFANFSAPGFFNNDYFASPLNNPGSPLTQTTFIIPTPSQLASVTVQHNTLEDMDILSTFEGEAQFVDALAYNGGLGYLQTVAGALQPLTAPAPATSEEAMIDGAQALSTGVRALHEGGETTAPTGATLHVAFGADTDGITLNGNTADEMPEISALSHRFAAEEEDTADVPPPTDEENNAAKTAEGNSIDETTLDPDIHEVATGGNVLLNEGYIGTDMLDAPVIVAMGQAVDLDIISQVNVWSDADMINGAAAANAATGTQAFNAAHFDAVANPAFDPLAEGEEPGDGPQNAAIVTLEGNFVNYNYVQQFNFANDGDVLSVGFSAQGSVIQTGDNTLVNSASILGLGFHYDLIIVDGDIVDVSFLSQTNVLLDSDTVHYGAGYQGGISTADNLMLNWATIRDVGIDQHHDMHAGYGAIGQSFANGDTELAAALEDPVFGDVGLLRVLHIQGSLINMQVLQQSNVLGDGDQVEFATQTLQSATGANVSVTTGQNELLNMAVITDAGLDSTIYTSEGAYTDAFLHQAEFVTDEDPLALAATDTLTGEAFLFLADGLLDQDTGEDAGIPAPAPSEVAVDVMETVLA